MLGPWEKQAKRQRTESRETRPHLSFESHSPAPSSRCCGYSHTKASSQTALSKITLQGVAVSLKPPGDRWVVMCALRPSLAGRVGRGSSHAEAVQRECSASCSFPLLLRDPCHAHFPAHSKGRASTGLSLGCTASTPLQETYISPTCPPPPPLVHTQVIQEFPSG